MGHQIDYLRVEYTPEAKLHIIAELNRWAFDPHETSSYHGNLTFHDKKVYDSEDEARQAIKDFDNGWYSDHAVLFNDYPPAMPSKKELELSRRFKKLIDERKEYINSHSISMFKAEFIGCPECKSKIAKKYIRYDRCPLCQTNLLSSTTVNKIKWYDEKISDLRDQIYDEQCRLSRKLKPTVKWLVKYEYHC